MPDDPDCPDPGMWVGSQAEEPAEGRVPGGGGRAGEVVVYGGGGVLLSLFSGGVDIVPA